MGVREPMWSDDSKALGSAEIEAAGERAGMVMAVGIGVAATVLNLLSIFVTEAERPGILGSLMRLSSWYHPIMWMSAIGRGNISALACATASISALAFGIVLGAKAYARRAVPAADQGRYVRAFMFGVLLATLMVSFVGMFVTGGVGILRHGI